MDNVDKTTFLADASHFSSKGPKYVDSLLFSGLMRAT
jgi:hypothetical protein